MCQAERGGHPTPIQSEGSPRATERCRSEHKRLEADREGILRQHSISACAAVPVREPHAADTAR